MQRKLAFELAQQLGRRAEAVCRHYLPSGRRSGRYWIVGDVRNNPGRSMFVRLSGPTSGRGAAGKWTDAATGEHGDLLDVIKESCGFGAYREVIDEAHRFLGSPSGLDYQPHVTSGIAAPDTRAAARRLFAYSQWIGGTLAQIYLRNRSIIELRDTTWLRFHPRCYRHSDAGGMCETWPALIAAATDLKGQITGVHRTWLSLDGSDKAPVDTPRRALGDILGHAVRFGKADDVLAVGEGIETVLSVHQVLPTMPLGAATSASHLAAILFPSTLRRLYILQDPDPAGLVARNLLTDRALSAGIEAISLLARVGDFNCELRRSGKAALSETLRLQLHPDDVARFMLA